MAILVLRHELLIRSQNIIDASYSPLRFWGTVLHLPNVENAEVEVLHEGTHSKEQPR